jgi:hypothetical protein
MAGLVKTGQSVTAMFTTSLASTGAASNADSTPTGTLYINGTANGASVTVTNVTTGRYKAAVTLPSLSAGDVVDLHIAATVSGVAGGGVVWSAVGDTYRISDSTPQTGDSYARLGPPAGASVSADIAANAGSLSTLLSRITGAVSLATTTTAAAIRSALGLASANLDTQLGDLPTAAENADAIGRGG